MRQVYRYREVDSTQTTAAALARQGAPSGTAVGAARQRRGRGRSGHEWASPVGCLYLSVIVDGPQEPLVSLVVGARLAEDLERRYGVSPRIKWPNDLVIIRPPEPIGKLAGILVEAMTDVRGSARLLVGVGLNVAAPDDQFPLELRPHVASLRGLVHPLPSLSEVEGTVRGAIESAMADLSSPPEKARGLREVERRLYGVGRPASLAGRPLGILRSIDPDGALRLEGPNGPVTVRAGEVVVE